jgi:hypothetical protein
MPPTAAAAPGRYVSAGAIAATLDVSLVGDRHVVRLSGGGARDAGAAAPADCHVRAVGTRRNDTLDATFTGIETETFAYSEARAQTEQRKLRLVFRSPDVEVTRADTEGYCGLGATFIGVYRREVTLEPRRRGCAGWHLGEQTAEGRQAVGALERAQDSPDRRLVRGHHRLVEFQAATDVIVGKLPPGTTKTSISGR